MAMQKVAINGPIYDFRVKLYRVFITCKDRKMLLVIGNQYSLIDGLLITDYLYFCCMALTRFAVILCGYPFYGMELS